MFVEDSTEVFGVGELEVVEVWLTAVPDAQECVPLGAGKYMFAAMNECRT